MGKQAQSRKLRAQRPPAGTSASERRVPFGAIAAGIAVLVVAGVVTAVAFAASSSRGGSGSLPAGVQTFDESNHSHVPGTVAYDRVPPAGGAHNGVQLNCGIYSQPVASENAVHSLEHGAVWITYQPNLLPDQVAVLRQLVTSNYVGTERYLILSPYAGIPSPIVASAWGAQLSVDQPSDPRLIQFIHALAGSGQGGEAGGACTGGVGTPEG